MFLEDVLGPLDGTYQNTGIIYICAVSTNTTTNNTYLGTAEGGFQKRYYNHKTSFQNRPRKNDTNFLNIFGKCGKDHALKWSVLKRFPPY